MLLPIDACLAGGFISYSNIQVYNGRMLFSDPGLVSHNPSPSDAIPQSLVLEMDTHHQVENLMELIKFIISWNLSRLALFPAENGTLNE